MTNLSTDLEDVWRDICEAFGFNESWLCDQTRCNNIQQKLLHFSHSHLVDPDHIDDVIQALSRGLYLTKSAVQWHEPAAGHHSTVKPNGTDKARGAQWRLVMTYGGFETTIKTLLNTGKRSLNPTTIQEFIDKCNLPNYAPLMSPNSARVNLEKWLKKPSRQKKSALADFLSLDNGDQKIIEVWIVESTPISNWADAVRLAKALRNATAHGALSATKIKEWGLQNTLLTLSDNLGELVLGGMQKLI